MLKRIVGPTAYLEAYNSVRDRQQTARTERKRKRAFEVGCGLTAHLFGHVGWPV